MMREALYDDGGYYASAPTRRMKWEDFKSSALAEVEVFLRLPSLPLQPARQADELYRRAAGDVGVSDPEELDTPKWILIHLYKKDGVFEVRPFVPIRTGGGVGDEVHECGPSELADVIERAYLSCRNASPIDLPPKHV